MRSSILLIALVLLFFGGAEAKYSPGLEIAEGENITLDQGFLFGASTDSYITPEFFGAVGDNSTNDTEALQDAIDYAYLNNICVQLGPKIYNFTGLQLYPGSNIKGISGDDVWQTTGYASALRYTGSGVAINCTNSTGGYNFKIRLADFAVLGPGHGCPSSRAGTGIYAGNLSEFQFSGMTVKGFNIGFHEDGINGVSIGSVRNSDICENDVAVYSEVSAATVFDACNFYSNNHIFDVKTAWNLRISNSQMELFDVAIYSNSSEMGDVFINQLSVVSCSINNEAVYFVEPFTTNPPLGHVPWNSHLIEITDGGDYHTADDTVVIYGLNLFLNEARVYNTDELIEFDLQDVADHGSSIVGNDVANSWRYTNTSVYTTVHSPYVQMYVQNSEYPGLTLSTGSAVITYGLEINGWWGIDVLGGLCLSQAPIYNEGNIWYDSSAKKLKFYDGTAERTVTSA